MLRLQVSTPAKIDKQGFIVPAFHKIFISHFFRAKHRFLYLFSSRNFTHSMCPNFVAIINGVLLATSAEFTSAPSDINASKLFKLLSFAASNKSFVKSPVCPKSGTDKKTNKTKSKLQKRQLDTLFKKMTSSFQDKHNLSGFSIESYPLLD
jgi:hypothetical protein